MTMTTDPRTDTATTDRGADRRDAGPLRRAGRRLRPDQPVLRRGLRGTPPVAATCSPRCPPTSAAAGSTWPRSTGSSAASPYVAPATAVAINMHHYFVGLCADLHRSGDPSRRLGAAAGGRRARVRRRPRRSGQRHPGAAVVDQGRARRRRLGVHRPQDLRQPVAGVDLPRRARDGHERPGRTEGRPRLHPSRHARATGSRRPGTRSACAPRRRTTRSSTAPSFPTKRSSGCRPAGFAGADMFHVALFAWALLGFAGVYSSIARRAYDETVASAPTRQLDRPDPLDGVPPRGAAPRRRDAHPPRGDERPPRPRVRRLVERRRPRHGLAGQDLRLQARRRHPRVGGRRHGARPHRRRRASSSATGSSSCSATPGSAASIPATRC